jgi:hypothetical protein
MKYRFEGTNIEIEFAIDNGKLFATLFQEGIPSSRVYIEGDDLAIAMKKYFFRMGDTTDDGK